MSPRDAGVNTPTLVPTNQNHQQRAAQARCFLIAMPLSSSWLFSLFWYRHFLPHPPSEAEHVTARDDLESDWGERNFLSLREEESFSYT